MWMYTGYMPARSAGKAALRGCATFVIGVGLVLAHPVAGIVRAQSPEAPRPSFSEWLAGVRSEALSRGIREEIVDAALADVSEPLPVILERDRSQAETVLSLEKYLARRVTPKLIKSGRDAYARERELVERIGERYGVPPRIIVAIWGAESNFGRFSGVRPTVSALATLAWDPRRATFFRGELFNALEILNRGDIDLPHLRGSWAGAMGQVQFMPSSYLKFAEDFDGDGRRDIWSTPSDVFASIANYLAGHGWQAGESWGREVKVTPEVARRIASDVAPRNGTCQATRNMTVALPLARWQELGVRQPSGKALPKSETPASLVSGTTRHFLVYPNYDALLEYNCAHSYAITVALLGDAIASTTPLPSAPKARQRVSRRR
jgi:membrane-bound lytic murein transglycosylase B